MTHPKRLNFRHALRAFVPPWLSNRPATPKSPAYQNGFKYLYAQALMLDIMMDVAVQALKARYPGLCQPDALPLIGQDRRIVRGLTEPDDMYAARLRAYLDSWRVAGNSYNMLAQLAPLFAPATVPLMRIVTNTGVWLTLNGDGSIVRQVLNNWNWDGSTDDRWARCWVIIYSGAGYPWSAEGVWSTGHWGAYDPTAPEHGTWGITATRDMVETILAVVQLWKAEHSLYPTTIIALDNATFDPAAPEPDGTWGKFYKIVGGVAVPSRLASARYFEGAS